MWDHEQHVSDEELLVAADGETKILAQWVQSHLKACSRCRTRAAEMESVLIELARAERSSLNAELPPIAGARAMLRLRMAELPTDRPDFFSWARISGGLLAGALGAATLAAIIVLAGVMTIRHSTTTGAPQLLSLDYGVLPNHVFTPGAARHASLAEVCTLSHEEVVKEVSPVERQKVFAEYGIPSAQSDRYEVDYLITPGLGGDDDIRNLWPEPYNAEMWNARKKDVLEERLHEMVCSHRLDLLVAQEAIATNWIAAYEKYVPATPPQDRDAKLSLQRRS